MWRIEQSDKRPGEYFITGKSGDYCLYLYSDGSYGKYVISKYNLMYYDCITEAETAIKNFNELKVGEYKPKVLEFPDTHASAEATIKHIRENVPICSLSFVPHSKNVLFIGNTFEDDKWCIAHKSGGQYLYRAKDFPDGPFKD